MLEHTNKMNVLTELTMRTSPSPDIVAVEEADLAVEVGHVAGKEHPCYFDCFLTAAD